MTAARTDGPETDRQPRWLDEDESRMWIAWVLSTRLLWDELERDLATTAT